MNVNTSPPKKHLPARAKIAIAAARSAPTMHWRWRHRGRDIVALLESRFGSALPDDDAGVDAAKLLAQHYMRLNVDAERVTRANLRLWAPWLAEKAVSSLIKVAKKAKAPSAAQLGKDFRVTAEEVAALGLDTITAFTVTLEGDRNRQDRRRRKAGATRKRGRPTLDLSPGDRQAHIRAQAAERKRRSRLSRKNSHAPSYVGGMKRDEFSVTHSPPLVTGIDLSQFGITAITVARGTDIVAAWTTR